MEDDLIFFERQPKKNTKNGRRPRNKIKMEDDLKHNLKNRP